MRLFLAILVGKLISYLSRVLRIGGGSAAPGLYALKVDSHLVEKLSSKIPQSVVITGTNGKTTTARLLSHLLTSQNLRVLRNHTGSNLERGIASALIKNCRLHIGGVKLNSDIAVWELDEAAFNKMAPILKPNIIVFLNVLRDQLDRYGEIDSVLKNWCKTLEKLDQNTFALINGDDTNLLELQNHFPGRTETFGLSINKILGETSVKPKPKVNLDHQAHTIQSNGLADVSFTLYNTPFTIPTPGVYHIYDALAALVCAYHLNLPINQLSKVLKDYSPAFGRFERFVLQPSRLRHKCEGWIFLIKNPAGATEVFKTLSPEIKVADRLLIALNDNFADGKDVSWIWDAEWERLHAEVPLRGEAGGAYHRRQVARFARRAGHGSQLICSGTRAQDLAVRLKYAGFDPKQITVENNLKRAFKASQDGLNGRLFILPTYTSLLELQRILANAGLKPHYWKEQ